MFHLNGRPVSQRWLFAIASAAFAVAVSAAASDSVTGTMTVAGKSYKLSHVSVRRQPAMTDKTKTVVVVLLTDAEVPKSVLDDPYRLELTDIARNGKLHGVSVTLGLDKKPSGTGFTYAKEVGGAIVSRQDQQTFEPAVFDDARVGGKLSGHGSFGEDTWEYSATFDAAVAKMK